MHVYPLSTFVLCCVHQVEVGSFGGVGYGIKAKADVEVSSNTFTNSTWTSLHHQEHSNCPSHSVFVVPYHVHVLCVYSFLALLLTYIVHWLSVQYWYKYVMEWCAYTCVQAGERVMRIPEKLMMTSETAKTTQLGE